MGKITVIPQKVNPITHLPTNAIQKKRVAAYARVSTDTNTYLQYSL